jgi:demethylmenaquinone methyltransferase/2-methoxy-6-polyprenyl-1,4-benzoquinol methylase
MNKKALKPATEIQTFFDSIAPQYEKLNQIMSLGLHRRWRARLINSICLQKSPKILDLACGTGDLLPLLRTRFPDAPLITGADLSYGMLACSEKNSKESVAQCSGISLPFKDNSFHAVTIAFGLRNMPDYQQSLKEIQRVLKPKGTIHILELTMPTSRILKLFYTKIMQLITYTVPRVTGTAPAPYQYLCQSIQAFPSNPVIKDMLAECGFEQNLSVPLNFGIVSIFTAMKRS